MSNRWRLMATRALLALLALLLLSPSAFAKGPIEATLEGPGLEAPIQFGGWSEPGATFDDERAPIGPLAVAAGFFQGAWGRGLTAKPPTDDLGPRYTLTYGLPGPENASRRIVQDVYPYAKPHPVTYMAPGQHIWGTMDTRGGWFARTSPHAPRLDYILTEAGLPRTPPAVGDDGSPFPWAIVGGLAGVAAALALGTVATVLFRRRPPRADVGSGVRL